MENKTYKNHSDLVDFRLLNSGDSNLLFNFNSNIENILFVPRKPFKTIDEAEVLLSKFHNSMEEKTAIWWTFQSKETGDAVGYGGLFNIDWENSRAEIGYGFLKEHWGKGYATSIVYFITSYGFSELKLHRVYGLVDPENKASSRVLEKNGYINEGVMRDYYYARGRYFDMSQMAKISI
ncbi:MAG: GNAT family N-acetyltransferase [Tenuifilaceae bacterium]